MPIDAESILAEVKSLDDIRRPWEGVWQELADIVHPRRGSVSNHATGSGVPQHLQHRDIFDGTAARANLTLANGQASRITPQGSRWFVLQPPHELQSNREVSRYYQVCGEILLMKLAGSNFYTAAHQYYLHRGAFGTAAIEIHGGLKEKGLHFSVAPISTYAIAENHHEEVDTYARTFSLTARQIAQRYDSIPKIVADALAQPALKNKTFKVSHLVRPRHDADPRKIDNKNMPILSVHVLHDEQFILAEGGFEEMPVAVSRWLKTEYFEKSPYGEPPAFSCLDEAAQLSWMEQMADVHTSRQLFPPVLAHASHKSNINFADGGITYFDDESSIPREWLNQGRYDIHKDRTAEKKQAIREAFFTDLFQAASALRSDATAEQVRGVMAEARELFHPIFSNMTREFLTPLLRRCFAILLRQGELPPPPQAAIMGDSKAAYIADPSVEFVSSLALALEQSHLINLQDILTLLTPLAQADPSALDFIATDKIGPALFRMKGLPSQFIRDEKEIQQIQQQRAEAQQAAQAAEQMKQMGGANGLAQAAQAASQIDPNSLDIPAQ